jgi:hypothetical protein
VTTAAISVISSILLRKWNHTERILLQSPSCPSWNCRQSQQEAQCHPASSSSSSMT